MTSPAMPSLPGTRMTWHEYLDLYNPEVYWFYTSFTRHTVQEYREADMLWHLRHTNNCEGVMDDDTLDWTSEDGSWGIKGDPKDPV